MTARTFAETELALKLLDAQRAFLRAEDNLRRTRELMLNDPRDEIAARSWAKACQLIQVASERWERLIEVIRISDSLNRELAS
jgi:hypothetical protein